MAVNAVSGVQQAEALFDGQQAVIDPVKAACVMQGGFLKLAQAKFYIPHVIFHPVNRAADDFQMFEDEVDGFLFRHWPLIA
jgi:hypothetical protein